MQRTPEEYKAAYLHHKNSGNADKAARVAQLYRQQLANQPKDGAFGYSVDQAQRMAGKGIEAVGRSFNSEAIADYGTGVVKQQDRDIAIGRYTPSYTKSLRETYNQDGLGAAAGWLGEKTAENAASAGTALGGAALTALTAPASMPLAAVIGGATTLGSAAMGAGEAAFEQEEKTGDYDAKLASGVGVLIGILDKFGAGKVIPKDRLMKMTAEQISAELSKKGFGEAAKTVLKRTGSEALTETAQEGLSVASAAVRGGEYTPEELGDRALEAAALGGTTSLAAQGGMGTLGAATNLVSGTKSNKQSRQTDEDVQAQASLAKTLSNIAFVNKHDLTDLDKMSTNGARETVDKAHIQYTDDLKQLFKDMKTRVAVTDQDTLEQVAKKVLAASAWREGRNKTKSTVGVQEMSALESLAGDTLEGQRALSILRQLNQLTELHNSGYQGGVSAITDQFAPFGSEVGYDKGAVQAEKRIRGLLTVGGAVATGGGSLLGQVALQGTGRMIDKVTGRRSVVDNFVKQNQGQPGIPGSASPSLREARIAAEQAAAQEAAEQAEAARVRQEQSAADEREANLRRVQQGAPPLLGSPEDIFRDGTGLDRDGLAQVIRIIKRNENTPAAVRKAVEQYETSIATGGRVDFGLIRDINVLVDQYPQLKELQVRERNTQAAAQGAQSQLSREDANYQRGIENNQAFNQELQNAVDDDGSIPPLNKAYLKSALADLARDLGAQPLDMVNSIIERAVEKGVTQEQMQSYLAPYLERVQQQQEAKNSRDQAAAEVDADPINENKTPVLQLIDGMTDKSIAGETLAEKAQKLRQEYEANPNSKTAKQAYLNARKERDAAGDFGQESTYDYRVQHQAPVSEDDASIHDLEKAMPDFYKRPRDYKTGSKLDSATLQILQQFKGAPEQIVKVYRAVPKDAPDSINYGDWVTVNKQYAEDHGAGMPDGYKIIEGAAPAKNIKTNGDSIHEFGYAQSKVGLVPIHHSTNNTFDDFDLDKSADRSIWFSDNLAEVEGGYDGASGSAIVVTRYIDETKLALANRGQEDKLTHTELQQMGYDGVKYVDEKDTVYQIYYPEKLEKQDVVNRAIKPGTGILSSAVSDYFKQPTPAQIKEQVEPAEQIAKFVLGKPGTEFENGISTYDDLVDLANMLDVSVKIVSASKMQDEGSMGQMQALLEGTAGEIKIQSVKKLGPLQFMKTLAHEVSHALEGLSLDRLRSESVYKYNAHPEARGSQDVMRDSSLRSRLNEVVEFAFAKPGMFFQKKHDSTPSAEVSKKIVAEIDELQKGTMVGFADKPELGQQPMRETFPQFTQSMLGLNVPLPENASATQIAVIEAEIAKMPSGGVAEQIAKQFVEYHDYIKETAEFGVDPLHFYLMDPKGMKKMMPETFKFMRDIFNKSSMPIEMHANPMMTVIALLLAGFGKALSGGEEEERPQGVLNPQPALLTT